MKKTICRLKIAHHTVKVEEVTIPGRMYGQKQDYVGYCYMITGGSLNAGSLHSERWSGRECLDAAIRKVREDHPKARLSWRTGDATALETHCLAARC